MCVGAIAGQDLGLGSNVWLLGDRYELPSSSPLSYINVQPFTSFMKNVYTVFDIDAKTVGFAQLSVGS